MKLQHNENSELIDICLPINQSLFNEIFNVDLFHWYKNLKLIENMPDKKYLHFIENRMLFDEEALKEAFMIKGIFSPLKKVLNSFSFVRKISKEIENYSKNEIDRLYKEFDIKKITKKNQFFEFNRYWNILIDNFKYSIYAGLMQQYNLKIVLPAQLLEDVTAKKINYMYDLKKGNITKKEFDSMFGFLSDSDYDMSKERYYELKKLMNYPKEKIKETPGPQNFRDYVKIRNIKMIAILRQILLKYNSKDIFYHYKSELEKKIDIKKRKSMFKAKKEKVDVVKDVKKEFSGKKFSGDGVVLGNICVISSKKDYEKVKKDDIIITKNLNPNLVILFPLIKGIVSETGGKLSHVSIVAREKNIPVLGQAKDIVRHSRNFKKVQIDLESQKAILK